MEKTISRGFNPTQGEKLWSQIKKQNTVYQEYSPSKELQEYIACYWFSKTISLGDELLISRVIPDGCMDIVFNMNEISQGKGARVSGIMTMPEIREVKEINEYVGIRFLPGGIIPFIKDSATNFTNQLIDLQDIWRKEGLNISQKVYEATSIEERIVIIEKTLKDKLVNDNSIPAFLKYALHDIYLNKGNLSIKELSARTYISERHLSRKFNEYIGTGTKVFSNIIRFQQVIRQIDRNKDIEILNLALNNGYYDQSHLNKEFKTFYGITPKRL